MRREAIANLLREVSPFRNLPLDQVEALARTSQIVRFQPQQVIFRMGDVGDRAYLVLTGAVNIRRKSHEDTPVHLALRCVGELFGEMALLDGKKRMADAVAAEECELLVLTREGLFQALKEAPEQAMAIMAERLREAGVRVDDLQTLNVIGRVSAEFLRRLEAAGISVVCDSGPHLIGHVNQEVLAEHLGTTRESVNRAFSSLKKMKAIYVEEQTVTVLSIPRLRRYCETAFSESPASKESV